MAPGCLTAMAARMLRGQGFEVVPPGQVTAFAAEQQANAGKAEEAQDKQGEKVDLERSGHDKGTAEYIRSFTNEKTTGERERRASKASLDNSSDSERSLGRRTSKKGLVFENAELPLSQMETEELTAGLHSWEFSAFDLAKRTKNHPLEFVALALMEYHDLLQHFNIPVSKFRAFVRQVESLYDSTNPYHSNVHAADVTQAVGMIVGPSLLDSAENLTSPLGIGAALTKEELFAVILAAIIHDVNHPGVTNDFLINTRSDVALRYNDRSVNENHHLCVAFGLAREAGKDIFKDMPEETFVNIRKLICDMVFSTDMAGHAALVSKFKAAVEVSGTDASAWEDRSLLLQMALHCADLSNLSRPLGIAELWADQVLTEFFRQGDMERDRGMKISPLCNRFEVKRANSQIGFIDFIVRPTLSSFAPLSPLFKENCLPNLESVYAYWTEQKKLEEVQAATA